MTGGGGRGEPAIRLGAHTFGLAWEADAATAISRLAGAGFTRFQLMAIPAHLDVRDVGHATLTRIRAAVAAAGGEILSIDLPSSDVNAASTTREVVDLTVELYVATLELAAALGSRWVTLLAGRRHALLPPPDDRLLSIVTGAFDRLVPVAERLGVRLLLENHPQSLTPTAADVAALLRAQDYPGVDALYDVANGGAVSEDPSSGIATLATHLGSSTSPMRPTEPGGTTGSGAATSILPRCAHSSRRAASAVLRSSRSSPVRLWPTSSPPVAAWRSRAGRSGDAQRSRPLATRVTVSADQSKWP